MFTENDFCDMKISVYMLKICHIYKSEKKIVILQIFAVDRAKITLLIWSSTANFCQLLSIFYQLILNPDTAQKWSRVKFYSLLLVKSKNLEPSLSDSGEPFVISNSISLMPQIVVDTRGKNLIPIIIIFVNRKNLHNCEPTITFLKERISVNLNYPFRF